RSNKWIGCYFREYAMGWGWIPTHAQQRPDQPHVDSPPDDFSAQDFWRWVREATDWDIFSGNANPLASSRAVAAKPNWRSAGLPNYFDIADRGRSSMRFAVAMRHPGPENIMVTTHSAAESYFFRPHPRRDGTDERANLFHPYWQARLAPAPNQYHAAGAP